jgi:DNA-binding winged helix-turn-helix (wHTH) protein/TolB-like protein/Tfp pilus assembly protein PilF
MVLKKQYFRFGNFRIYPTEHLLLREGHAISLAPKVFDILLYLVQNSGHLVKRDALMDAVWPDSFVEETNLTVNISLLRKVLGNEDNGRPYIETVPRKGYRFQAEVSEEEETDGSPPEKPPATPVSSQPAPAVVVGGGAVGVAVTAPEIPSREPPSPQPLLAPALVTRRPAGKILAFTAVAIALAAAAIFWLHQRRAQVVSASARSIAILPFQALDTAPQDDYLGIGMTDALITRLSNLHRIVVRPVGAVRKYATATDPIAAGRQLAVQSVLEGSIQRSGDRTRVTVRLLRVSDGEQLWGSEFDEKVTDMFGVEDSISEKVASALVDNLSGDEQQRLTRPFTENNDAYQLYMKGRYFWNKRTVDGVQKSLDYFEQAIGADPKYAVAYAGLADAYTLAGSYGYSIMPPREAMPKAEAAVKKALAIDDTLAEAHASLAYIKFTYDWDWAGAEQEFKRALNLNPGYDTAHHWYSHELMALGRPEEGLEEARRALELSPSDTVMNEHLAWTYLMARDYDHAIQSARKALELDPNFMLAHRVLGQAYMYRGQYEDASAEFQKGVELSRNDPVAQAFLARAYAVSGRKQDALKILEDLQKLSAKQYVPPVDIAAAYAALDAKDLAFQWLNRGYENRSSFLAYLKVDRAYDSLRSDPRFAELLKRMNLA